MAKRISSQQFLKIIKAHGFDFISQAGCHAKSLGRPIPEPKGKLSYA